MITARLDLLLPDAVDGRRVQRVPYEYGRKVCGNAGRRYATAERQDYGDGKLRCATPQGMPNDLRPPLLGKYLYDLDGINSDLTLYVIRARQANLSEDCTTLTRAHNANRKDWQYIVVSYYLADAKLPEDRRAALMDAVKRWPNKMANTCGHVTLLRDAGLPLDIAEETTLVKPLRHELLKLKERLLDAPCNKAFVDRQDAHLKLSRPDLDRHQRRTKIYSWFIQTAEDECLATCVKAVRRLNRAAVGKEKFDAMPPERRDTGALTFDGHMPELLGGVTVSEAKAACNDDLAADGYGEYKIDDKPMFGLQNQPVKSMVLARQALQEATAKLPALKAAIERACADDQLRAKRDRPGAAITKPSNTKRVRTT